MQWICLIFLLIIAYVSSEETLCREGWYGVDCGLQCSSTCRPLETFPCNKETGKCSEGCQRGFYGPQCEKNCPCTGPCIQETGDCIGYQTKSTTQPTTKSTTQSIPLPQPQPCQEKNEVKLKNLTIIAIALGVLFALLLCTVALSTIFRRRKPQRATPPVDETAMDGVCGPLIAKNNDFEKSKLVEDLNIILKNLDLCEQSTYYLLKDRDLKRSAFLQCTWLELDTEKVNLTAAHLDVYGKLSNKPETSRCQQDGSLKHYSGTTTSAPLQPTGLSQYWEVQNNIAFNKTIPENETLVDLGFRNDIDRDKERFTPDRKPYFSLKVYMCSTHKSICFKVFSGKKDECYQPTVEGFNIDDDKVSTFSCKFGLLMQGNGKKITFFDLDNLKIIRTASIDFEGKIWPMFGLASEDRTSMNVTLVCGNAIAMADEKMTLIKSVTG